jgi:glycosyltransferase involved in cell wall biosynthesis
VRVLARGLTRARSADLVYVTISQSRLGFAKDLLLLQWAATLGRPVVVHMHGGNFAGFFGGLSRPEQALVRATLSRLFAIVVLTESLRADFRMSPGWQSQTVAISNTCDTPRGKARLHPGKIWKILFLSNLLVSKGYRETILAVGELGRRRPELSLSLEVAGAWVPEEAFADARAQEADLKALLSQLPPNVTATFAGVLAGDEKNARLAAADVFVLPTDYVNEGQPIAIIEALCAGLPVIATDWRGIKETVPPGMHPLLVPQREVETLVDRLSMLVDDAAMFEGVSQEALLHAERFRPERHLAALDAVFREALASARKGVLHVG